MAILKLEGFIKEDPIPKDLEMKIEEQPELTMIYGYNPDSLLLSHLIETILQEGEELEEFTTLTAPPAFNKELQIPKYQPSVDKWVIVDIEDPLKGIKDYSKNEVDVEIKTVMRKMVTVSAQNSGLYDMKYDESVRYLDSDKPTDLTDYPLLKVGAEVSGLSGEEYANLIIQKRAEYQQKMTEMETIRLKAKADIDAVVLGTGAKAMQTAKDKIEKISQIAALKLYNL